MKALNKIQATSAAAARLAQRIVWLSRTATREDSFGSRGIMTYKL
jgi:hypothetical protein